jgi:RNA polymerase sigma factor (TIGR02999 family)
MTSRPRPREHLDELVASLYSTLRDIAGNALERNAGRRSISPTDLVHDCYVKLARAKAMKDLRPTEFVALASRAIRNVLVDRARERGAVKRGGRLKRVTLNGASLALDKEIDLLRLDDALKRLFLLDERQAKVVELRFFGGLSHEEIARLLKCSERTVTSEWAMAKAWLHRELARE